MADHGAPNPNPPGDGSANPHPLATNQDKVAQIPNPEEPLGPQYWEPVKDLKRAKEIIARFRSSATRRAINDQTKPYQAKVQKAMMQCYLEWGILDVEVDQDLAENGRAAATHFVLRHNHVNVPGGLTDHQAIQQKKARFTISRARHQCRVHDMAAVREGCQLWVTNFLERLPGNAFDGQFLALIHAIAGRR
jgi:hypothetical protein